jgi:GNAT superfamily N-acetyltransferase
MPFILADFAPNTVIEAMAANLSQYNRFYAELPGGELHIEPDCTWIVSGVPEKWFNVVLDNRFEEKGLRERVAALLNEFRRRGLPMSWTIFPGATPPNLPTVLLTQGLLPDSAEPGMALDLLNLAQNVRQPGGLTIERVAEQSALREWAGVWLAEIPESIADHCREVVYASGIEEARPWRYYLGRLNGKAAACLKLFYAAGVVSVQHVATLYEARNQGIATALTVHALHQAREAGYRVAVLTSTPEGLPVYRRIGFRTLATFQTYGWYPH